MPLTNLTPGKILQMSEKTQLEKVKIDGAHIQHFENPSEKVQLAAVKQDPYAIEYIKNPSEKVQLAVVKNNWRALLNDNFKLTEKVQLAVVKQQGQSIKFFKASSNKVLLAAVKNTYLALKYIKNPSEDMQLAAIKQRDEALEMIEKPTQKALALYKRLYGVPTPEEIAAITNNVFNILNIKNPSAKLLRLADTLAHREYWKDYDPKFLELIEYIDDKFEVYKAIFRKHKNN